MRDCMDAATTDAARKVGKTCEDNWAANKDDCNRFVQAVASALHIPIPAGQADDVINYMDASPSGWTRLTGGDHQSAHDQASLASWLWRDCLPAKWASLTGTLR